MLKLYYRNKNRKSDISNISGREISKKQQQQPPKKIVRCSLLRYC